MPDIYGSPEQFGLEVVGDIEFSSGSYEFDIVAVWKLPDGTYAYGSNSGCSCPSPFEDFTVAELDPLVSLDAFKDFLVGYDSGGHESHELEIAALLEKLHGLGVR